MPSGLQDFSNSGRLVHQCPPVPHKAKATLSRSLPSRWVATCDPNWKALQAWPWHSKTLGQVTNMDRLVKRGQPAPRRLHPSWAISWKLDFRHLTHTTKHNHKTIMQYNTRTNFGNRSLALACASTRLTFDQQKHKHQIQTVTWHPPDPSEAPSA